jgi:AFG3 family protein
MSDTEQKDTNTLAPARKPRRRYQIWVIVGMVVLILVASYFKDSDLTELPSSKFEPMVQNGDVRKLVVVENEHYVEITLAEKALQYPQYRKELERNNPLGLEENAAHYRMKIGSTERFIDNYEDLTKNIPREQKVDLRFEERADVLGVILQWGFLFVILTVFVILVNVVVKRVLKL